MYTWSFLKTRFIHLLNMSFIKICNMQNARNCRLQKLGRHLLQGFRGRQTISLALKHHIVTSQAQPHVSARLCTSNFGVPMLSAWVVPEHRAFLPFRLQQVSDQKQTSCLVTHYDFKIMTTLTKRDLIWSSTDLKQWYTACDINPAGVSLSGCSTLPYFSNRSINL